MADQHSICTHKEKTDISSEEKIFDLELQVATSNAETKRAIEEKSRAERQVAALKKTISFLRNKQRENNRGIINNVGSSIIQSPSPTGSNSWMAMSTPTRKRKCLSQEEDANERLKTVDDSVEFDNLKTEIINLKKNIHSIGKQLEDKTHECSAVREEILCLEKQLDTANKDKSRISTDFIQMKNQVSQTELSQKETIRKMREEIMHLEKLYESKMGLLVSKDDEVIKLQKSLANAQNDNNRISSEVYQLKCQTSQTELSLNETIQKLRKETTSLEKLNKSNIDLLVKRDGEIRMLQFSLAEVQCKLNTNKQVQIEQNKSNQTMKLAKDQNMKLHEQLQQLKKELMDQKQKNQVHERSITKLREKVDKDKSFRFPRITGDMNVSTLKAEAKERGLLAKQANAMKKGDLVEFIKMNTIHLSEIKRIMRLEENPEAEARREAEEKRLKEAKAARLKDERERKAAVEREAQDRQIAEKMHNEAYLTKKIAGHPCPLGPSGSLVSNGIIRANLPSLVCDIGHCNNKKYLSPGKKKCPEWSCVKCDWDICAFCLDIMALSETERPKKLANIEEEKKRTLREKWAWYQDFPSAILTPKMPKKAKRRFAVMACRGDIDRIKVSEFEWDSDVSKQFDSAFETLEDANHRAQHVFYCKNKYNEPVEVFGETRNVKKETDDDGMLTLYIVQPSFWTTEWKVFVVSYSEYDEKFKKQQKEIKIYEKKLQEKKELEKKKQEEKRKSKEELIKSLQQIKKAPKRIANPPAVNKNSSKSNGYTVVTSYSRRNKGHVGGMEFDSSFKIKVDANLRARYLCYIKETPFNDCDSSYDVSEWLNIPCLKDKLVDGMVHIEYNDDYGNEYSFTVLPDEAFSFINANYDHKKVQRPSQPPPKSKLEKLPAKARKPPAANTDPANKKKYTVWSSCGYGYDGWHSYDGPPSKTFFASFDTLDEANAAAQYKFFVDNPYEMDPDDEYEFGHFTKNSKLSCVEYSMHPDDSECWTVAVAPSNVFAYLENSVDSDTYDKSMTMGDYCGIAF